MVKNVPLQAPVMLASILVVLRLSRKIIIQLLSNIENSQFPTPTLLLQLLPYISFGIIILYIFSVPGARANCDISRRSDSHWTIDTMPCSSGCQQLLWQRKALLIFQAVDCSSESNWDHMTRRHPSSRESFAVPSMNPYVFPSSIHENGNLPSKWYFLLF